MTKWRWLVAAVMMAVSSCSRAPEERTYQLSGQVLAVKADDLQILIQHGDIQGFMPAMTMPYKIGRAHV